MVTHSGGSTMEDLDQDQEQEEGFLEFLDDHNAGYSAVGLAVAAAPRSTPKLDRAEVLAGERRLMRRQFPEPPSISELKAHAKRFGTAQVLETAASCGYGPDSLLQLCESLDVIDRGHSKD